MLAMLHLYRKWLRCIAIGKSTGFALMGIAIVVRLHREAMELNARFVKGGDSTKGSFCKKSKGDHGMDEKLSHLSAEEVKTLRNRYYQGESTNKLIKEYGISARPNNLYKLFPPEEVEEFCEYCGVQLVRNCVSKSAYQWRNDSDIYCPVCGHKPHVHCRCENCIHEEQELADFQRMLIEAAYSQNRPAVKLSELTFEQRVFLGTLCWGLGDENMSIKPYNGANVILTPTDDLRSQVYESLNRDDIITVSPASPLTAFEAEDENFPYRYFVYEVQYSLNLAIETTKEELFSKILNPTCYPFNREEALQLWKKIAIAECLEYLGLQLHRVSFPFHPGDKTYKMFEILLDDFSVAQIYGIIWRAVAEASKLYLERERVLSKKHAANTVIGFCERYAGRAKANGWTLKGYNRPRELPQSTLSSFFYNRVLGIGDAGFECCPTIDKLSG